MPQKVFERSEETTALVNYLKMLEKSTVVPYADLSKLVHERVTSRYAKLISARTILQRDYAAIWICIRPGIGIKRLSDIEIAERLPTFWLNGARNKLKRGGHQSETVELRQLDADQQTRFGVDCIQRELAFDALSRATRRKMERVARGTSNDLPSFTAIEWAISLSPKNRK